MRTITQAVFEIISKDIQAMEYLKNGLLNTSQYARKIQKELEEKLYKKISLNSIVSSLSRIKEKAELNSKAKPKFKIDDIKIKLPISEIVFAKTKTQTNLSKILEKYEEDPKVYLNINNVDHEIDIFVSSQKAKEILKILEKDYKLIEHKPNLVAITLEYNPEFRNYSGMAAQVLNLLAINNINMLECLTTYSEFVIYIDQKESQKTVEALQNLL